MYLVLSHDTKVVALFYVRPFTLSRTAEGVAHIAVLLELPVLQLYFTILHEAVETESVLVWTVKHDYCVPGGSIRAYVYVYIHIPTCTRTHTYTRAHTLTLTHTHTHAHTHTHTHAHTHKRGPARGLLLSMPTTYSVNGAGDYTHIPVNRDFP